MVYFSWAWRDNHFSQLALNYLGGVGPLRAGGPLRADGHPGGGVQPDGAGENFSATGSSCCGSAWAQLEACWHHQHPDWWLFLSWWKPAQTKTHTHTHSKTSAQANIISGFGLYAYIWLNNVNLKRFTVIRWINTVCGVYSCVFSFNVTS